MDRLSNQLSNVRAYIAPSWKCLSSFAEQTARNLSRVALPLIAMIVIEQIAIANAQLCTDTAVCRFGCGYGQDIIANALQIEACYRQCATSFPCN